MRRLSVLDWIAISLVVIGAINWGLWGIFEFNLVAWLFGTLSPISRFVYVLVALAGIYLLFAAGKRYRTPEPRAT